MNSDKITIAAAVLFFGAGKAQQTAYYTPRDQYHWNLADQLFRTKNYSAAQYGFAKQYFYNENLPEYHKEAARFFDTVIAVILQKNHAEEGLDEFIKEYPNSAHFAQTTMPLADYYLAKKDFPKALETLRKVNQNQLSRQENMQYILKLGYAEFMNGDTKAATEALEEAYRNVPASEKGDVAYMLGHLYYTEGQNTNAFQYFDSIKNDEKYAQLVRPYYVQLYYNQKDYDKAISEGNELLNNNISESYKAEVHKIIGESYFMKEYYNAAYPHLKSYLEAQEAPTDKDLYEMGFVAAKLAKYDEAVSYYNRLLNSNSAMAQNAYYQLGNAYLQTNKKQEALSAFRSAYQMNYDATVQQLAHAQYAKLGYELGNPFESAPEVLQRYISKYPASPETSELKGLLVKSYLYSGNYRETLAAIDKLPNSSVETDKIDQEVSFLLGTEEFNKGNYDEAEKFLLRSLQFNNNAETNSRALYWLGQTYFQKGNYPSAIVRYNKISGENFPEKQQLNYDLGYAYFKLKKFSEARDYFKKYLENPKPDFKNDAELRLADTYYADNQLNEAIAIYDKADNADDYTLYQKALALGFKGDTAAKISTLKNLFAKYPNSEYSDDANYEMATAYAAQDDYSTSNNYLEKVIKTSADKDLVASAKIYRAQNLYDLGQNEKALAEFKNLGAEYRNTSFAKKIAQAVRPVYLKNGDASGYQDFTKSIGVNLDATEIGEINLTTGKNYFASKDFAKAIPLYEKYLNQNPQGDGVYQAKYELAESYYQTKNTAKALLVFQDVAQVQNDYQTDAQTRLAQIYLSQNNPKEAKTYLEILANTSDAAIRNYADAELMKIYADEKDYTNAEKYATQVLANPKNSASVQESAKAIKARGLMNSGKDRDAQSIFTTLEKSANTEVAAEALYAKAYYQNKAKAYKSSNETIFKLANNYASEQYWGAKSLLIMAKNYLGLRDNYQASYTVDQVLANYQEFADVVAEAKEIKSKIKK